MFKFEINDKKKCNYINQTVYVEHDKIQRPYSRPFLHLKYDYKTKMMIIYDNYL